MRRARVGARVFGSKSEPERPTARGIRTRVLFVIDQLLLGGSELQLVSLVRGLDRRRYEVYFCHFRPHHAAVPDIDLGETTVVYLDRRRRYDPHLLWRLRSLIRDERIQILYTVLSTADIWGRVAGVMASVPAIVCRKGTLRPGGSRGNYEVLFDRLLVPYTSCVVSNSRAGLDQLIKSGRARRERSAVVYNGTDLARFKPVEHERMLALRAGLGIDPEAFVVGGVGRLSQEKGWDTVVETMAWLRARRPEKICCVIVGDGKMMPGLQDAVSRLGLDGQVVLLGDRTDVPDVVACMDVVVLASDYEGIPNALCEAMAMKKPVISTDVGGVRELIIDGECGLLVEPRHQIQLGEAICKMLGDGESRRRWGACGRRRVEELFSIERMIAETDRVLQRVIDPASHTRDRSALSR